MGDVDPVVFSATPRDMDLITSAADVARAGTLRVEGDEVVDTALGGQVFGGQVFGGQVARDDVPGVLPGFAPRRDQGLFLPTEDPLLRYILRVAHACVSGTYLH